MLDCQQMRCKISWPSPILSPLPPIHCFCPPTHPPAPVLFSLKRLNRINTGPRQLHCLFLFAPLLLTLFQKQNRFTTGDHTVWSIPRHHTKDFQQPPLYKTRVLLNLTFTYSLCNSPNTAHPFLHLAHFLRGVSASLSTFRDKRNFFRVRQTQGEPDLIK